MTPGTPPSGPVPGGNVSDIAVDAIRLVPGESVVLGRDSVGIYAMSSICTHQGGPLYALDNTAASGLECPWHHSRFNGTGVVTRGPAGTNLQHYQVDIASDGTITIQGGILVDPSMRTPVPTADD